MFDAHSSAPEAVANFGPSMGPVYENWLTAQLDAQAEGCIDPPDVPVQGGGIPPVVPPWNFVCTNLTHVGGPPPIAALNAGSIPDVVPWEKLPYGSYPGDPAWQVALEVVGGLMVTAFSDLTIGAAVLPGAVTHLNFLMSVTNASGVLPWATYGDWLPAVGGLVSRPFVGNAYAVYAFQQAAAIASALGQTGVAMALLATEAKFSANVGAIWFGNAAPGVWANDADTYNILSLQFDLAPNATAPYRAAIQQRLATNVRNNGSHTTAGAAGVRWLLDVLTEAGAGDVAAQWANNTDFPSLGLMVTVTDAQGTLWEDWTGTAYSSDGSKDHVFLGAGVGVWFHEQALGLRFAYGWRPDNAAPCSAECESLLAQSLPRRWERRVYLPTAQHRAALCDVLLSVLAGSGSPSMQGVLPSALAAARVALAARGLTDAAAVTPGTWGPTATLELDAQIVRAVQHASGHRDTPLGRAEASWSLDAAASALTVRWQAPPAASVAARVALPLGAVCGADGTDATCRWWLEDGAEGSILATGVGTAAGARLTSVHPGGALAGASVGVENGKLVASWPAGSVGAHRAPSTWVLRATA
jgi:hypothetical protein